MKLKLFLSKLLSNEKTGGLILIFATLLSLTLANSSLQVGHLWHTNVGGHSVVHWINDGLMTIFFLLIGLELKKEVLAGELSKLKNASLPFFGAMGGMIIPAALFSIFNFGTITQAGAGIPMATDIAFAIGILSLLGNRVPLSLKIFLTALAVIDDLGAILVIAIFYTGTISFSKLFLALSILGVLLLLNRMKVNSLIPYLAGGTLMWYLMLHSGIHATITGVLLAIAIPYSKNDHHSPSEVLQHILHKPVAFIILPLFAMANTYIEVGEGWQSGLSEVSSLGIVTGLVIGKPLGIFIFTFLAAGLGLCTLPQNLRWNNIIGVGLLAGIGFTMSIFITLLAFDNSAIVDTSKIAILTASLLAAVSGFIYLKLTLSNDNSLKREVIR
jgi:Na+:H+ antiporter, NhaA family